jgi:hypothetical protein
MDNLKACLFLLVLVGFVSGCKKEESIPAQTNESGDYYPLAEGQVWHWLVQDSVFLENDTTIQQWVETDSFRAFFYGQNGVEIFPRDIYRKTSLEDSISTFQVRASAYRAGNYLFEQEENKPVAVLQLPLQVGAVWDANAFNSAGQELRTMKTFNYLYEQIPNCLLVTLMLQNSSLVDQYEIKEIFAAGKGQVYSWYFSREYTFVDGSPVLVRGYTREKKRIGL